MSNRGWLALALALALHGAEARAGDAGSEDAGAACDATSQCVPAHHPYCHPELNVCVECVGDVNCSGKVCDRARGRCSECVLDGDCAGESPYCDRERGVCVQCLSDGNCAGHGSAPRCDTVSGRCAQCVGSADCAAGQECRQNVCTRCGDGVCQPDELLIGDPARPESIGRQCFDDCKAECPSQDLGSEVGTFHAENTVNRWEVAACSGGDSGPDASFRWTAPRDGKFSIDSFSSTVLSVTFAIVKGDCQDALGGTSPTCEVDQSVTSIDAAKGESFVFVLNSNDPTPGTLALRIQEVVPPCNDPSCMRLPGDAGTLVTRCLDNAGRRGEPVCAAAECACRSCPNDYDDCAVVPNCRALFDCMKNSGCKGMDCYTTGACRDLIDSLGGSSGPAFAAARRLQACDGFFSCALPCAPVASDADAGTADGGTGDRGNVAAATGAEPANDCGCRAPGRGSSGDAFVLVLTVGVLFTLRRRAGTPNYSPTPLVGSTRVQVR